MLLFCVDWAINMPAQTFFLLSAKIVLARGLTGGSTFLIREFGINCLKTLFIGAVGLEDSGGQS
jgi:uncharacterized membrane protein YhfC